MEVYRRSRSNQHNFRTAKNIINTDNYGCEHEIV